MRTLILGFDAFDPGTFERLVEAGKMPNLAKYTQVGGYSRMEVSIPPQTEVSWTSIATGLNPGGHGIFDFVHRDPSNYTPYVSLLPTTQSVLGVQFSRPVKANTIFEEAANQGFPATALWWPATFPARPESPVQTIPGLGAPDIRGRLGVGTLFCSDRDAVGAKDKTPVEPLEAVGKDRYTGQVKGPLTKKGGNVQEAATPLQIEILDERSGRLVVDGQSIPLALGKWSTIFEVKFKVGFMVSVRAIARAVLTQIKPDVVVYFSPLQIHPLYSPWRYATPQSFVKQVWKDSGPFLSLGWPQDTTALEEGCITDQQFLELCDSIFETRERILMHQVERFPEGVLASIFDCLDRVQHMFRRDRPDVVDEWYIKLDQLVGRVQKRLMETGKKQARFFVLSDHGFADFTYKVHLNRWLVEQGHLTTSGGNGAGSFKDVDWSKSQAYAVGLNSLYLNLAGREGKGVVTNAQRQALVQRLRDDLVRWRGLDGRPVVQRAWLNEEAFSGPYSVLGPDLSIGFTPGYRASAETGLGKWESESIQLNRDHWGADHCVEAQAVPGVLFTNQDLTGYPHPSYRDIPVLAIGKALDQNYTQPPAFPTSTGESQEAVEERLKSLGYL